MTDISIREKKEKEEFQVKTVDRLSDMITEEVSVVDRPANNRRFLLVKRQEEIQKQIKIGGDTNLTLNKQKSWDRDAAIKRIKEWAGGPDKDSIDFSKYKKAFIVWDTSEPENFGSYNLPFADIVDGKLIAVSKGLIAARQALSGARGGASLPSEVISKAQNFVDGYIGKMEKEDKAQDQIEEEVDKNEDNDVVEDSSEEESVDKSSDSKEKEETSKEEKEVDKNEDNDVVEDSESNDDDVEKVGSKMEETRLSRMKSAINMLKEALLDLRNGSSNMEKFKKAAVILNQLLSEVSKNKKGMSEVTEMDSETRSGDDPSAANSGSGLQPDEETIKTFKEFFSKIPELSSLIKIQEENKKSIEELKESLYKKDKDLENKDKEINKLKEEMNRIKKHRSAPSSNLEVEDVNKGVSQDKTIWTLDMSKEMAEKEGWY